MKNAIVLLIAVLSSACVSNARVETLEKRLADSEEQNRRLRAANAKGYQPPGAPQLPSERPVPPSVGSPMVGGMGGQSGAHGAAWAYQRHGVYVGTVGDQPRQVTQGRKLRLDNQVCDGGSRDVWAKCGDADDNGAPDLNTWLAFEIDGQPVVCDSGFFHPESQVSLLPPGQTCHVELGRSRSVKLTIKAYRNSGTATYVMLDTTPYATSYRKVAVGDRNVAYFGVDETRF